MPSFLDPNHIGGALLLALLFLIAGAIFSRVVRGLFREALRHDRSEHIDQTTLSFLSHLSVLVVWLLLLTFYAHLIPALNRLGTALLAGVSLMSVILGFAAQATLGNLVAGISLVLYKPFRRGDRLQIQAPGGLQIGKVEDISLGYTVLRTDDRRHIIVSNGTMAQQTMIRLPPDIAVEKAAVQSDGR
jgi:small conductance mechanosensitive channel